MRGGRVLVFGSRTYTERAALWNALGERSPAVVIEGEAKGADTLGRQWAQFYRRPFMPFPADWDRLGKKAGPLRNEQQLREGRPDEAIGGISGPPGSEWSRGSADMARRVLAAGLPLSILRDGGAVEPLDRARKAGVV